MWSGSLSNYFQDDSDISDDDVVHNKMIQNLLKDINAPTNKKRRHDEIFVNPSKAENAWDVSGQSVNINELLELADSSDNVKKKLKKLETSDKKLNASLSKAAQQRLDRTTQYEDTKELVGEWQPTVQAMRQAESLQFPLPEQAPKAPRLTTASLTASHKSETELESGIEKVLQQSGINEKKLQEIEVSQLKEISPEELKARRAHLAKVRSLFFFQEQKNKRNAKKKSKKFRKHLRMKKEKGMPSLEELRETDPEAYEEALKKRETERVKERILLRHKSQTKWAKFALKSDDPNLKRAAQDHLRLGRDLIRKMHDEDGEELPEDDEEYEEFEEEEESEEVDMDIIGIDGERINAKEVDDDDDDDDEENVGRRSFTSRGQISEVKTTAEPKPKKKKDAIKKKESSNIDSVPSSFAVEDSEDDSDDDEAQAFNLSTAESTSREQRDLINRAFAADHITEDQIAQEKLDLVQDENDVEKEYSTLTMPGWGEWAGNGVKPSKRREKMIAEMEFKKAKKERELLKNRKDAKLKHVLINQKKNKKFESQYTLEEVPYPYRDKDLYERSIRQPLGKEWNTYGSHKALIKPKIIVKGGTVIDPIKKKKKINRQ